jgi:hypothetical protein
LHEETGTGATYRRDRRVRAWCRSQKRPVDGDPSVRRLSQATVAGRVGQAMSYGGGDPLHARAFRDLPEPSCVEKRIQTQQRECADW